MKVRLTEPAAYDIRRVTDRIASDDPVRAERVAGDFQAALHAIGNSPFLCSPIRRSRGTALRKKSVKPYVILFEVVANEAWILRIAHERSDWTSLA